MTAVLVTGAGGPLGRRVLELVEADPEVGRVVSVEAVPVDRRGLEELLDGIEVVVHLGSSLGPELDGTGARSADVDAASGLLDAGSRVGVRTLVVLSTAMVYGAWGNNPIPLTEDAPIRPNPSLRFAVQKAEVERLAHEWRRAHPDATVAVLRPPVALAEESSGWLVWSLWGSGGVGTGDAGPPMQFVHLDDLASAIDLARRNRLDGVYNVAPDGWIPPAELRELGPPASKLRLPGLLATRVAGWRWQLGLTPTPPDVLPYTIHPWVVASDRLRAAGWAPASSNQETFVLGSPAGPLAALSPRRRQELALAGSALALAGLGAGVILGIRWLGRRSGRDRPGGPRPSNA